MKKYNKNDWSYVKRNRKLEKEFGGKECTTCATFKPYNCFHKKSSAIDYIEDFSIEQKESEED